MFSAFLNVNNLVFLPLMPARTSCSDACFSCTCICSIVLQSKILFFSPVISNSPSRRSPTGIFASPYYWRKFDFPTLVWLVPVNVLDHNRIYTSITSGREGKSYFPLGLMLIPSEWVLKPHKAEGRKVANL